MPSFLHLACCRTHTNRRAVVRSWAAVGAFTLPIVASLASHVESKQRLRCSDCLASQPANPPFTSARVSQSLSVVVQASAIDDTYLPTLGTVP
ncbi:hypothetical protein LX32DRAFT_643334 [Colletotrichum zoysiae]|uniref:Uncharacterized protein n=1 Tax=Colletotrichum zoysiae TaxID=1216348 RepID=A0AAD9H9K3_9PEZI|nr:hypothetical protein LX32DRAFT_643334 [Colletotrichum zoysiae]